VEIQYETVEGPDLVRLGNESLPSRVASALGVPLDRVKYLISYRDDQPTYGSDIIQIQGVETNRLLEAVITNSGFDGERRLDQIAGKSVVRAATTRWTGSMDETPYFYAFEDVVAMMIGDRPLVEEALRGLP
jgi:hypothetical protein